jgi:zinc D-Ala-D-Ala dipeptidase
MISRRVLALLVAASAGCTAQPAAHRPPANTTLSSASSSPASVTSVQPVTPAQPVTSVQPITPTKPVTPTKTAPAPARSSSPAARPLQSVSSPTRPVSAEARAAGLVEIRTAVPDAIVDLRYATSHNFVGVPLYPAGARCLVHQSMAPGLKVAADRLRRAGYLVVFWDCYRPHSVQVRMFQIVADPNWVARPGPYARSHEAGRSVDVTLAYAGSQTCPVDQRIQSHCLVEMGTGFDDFSARAHAFASDGVSPAAQANRARLRSAMNAGGITVYSGEWWHFDGPGASVGRPHLNAPLD